MDLLVNDLSLHGQFANLDDFRESIRRVMAIREIARRHLRELYCHRNFVNGQVNPQFSLAAAVQRLTLDERRSVMAWLSQQGPFWDDGRRHGSEDWYECGEDIVTDTAIGEAAHCLCHGIDRGLVSLEPSNFLYDPVPVTMVTESNKRSPVEVRNYWDPTILTAELVKAPRALVSWAALEEQSVARFEKVKFAGNAFEPLRSQPYKQGVAERILARLDVLERLQQRTDETGMRTREGNELYDKHFTGDKAWFSDESDTNKAAFRQELTFPNPDASGKPLFCSWHGKLKTPQYRIHFAWPETAASPLYVVYVGPKITTR